MYLVFLMEALSLPSTFKSPGPSLGMVTPADVDLLVSLTYEGTAAGLAA